jgi:FkbM family methyltransferase
MLGGRSPRLVVESALAREHWVALAGMPRRYPDFLAIARRYFTGSGDYPYAARVRTPVGIVAPMAYSHHDIFTVHEIFGREDYRATPDLGVVVDVGSNIGISALYMLTRNDRSRCYLYEPVPRNVQRLRGNLAGYESRYELQEVAVATRDETVRFSVEPTGRYGGIGVELGEERIDVCCRAVSSVIADVLEREPSIDVLKIDTEGAEVETVRAIEPELLSRIKTIYFETRTPFNPAPDRFTMRYACETCRLRRRDAA